MTPAARVVDRAIEAYRRRISPRKGWSCAARVAGGASCSTAVQRSVRAKGLVATVPVAVLQLLACWSAARLLMASDVRGVCCCGPIPIPFRF